MESANIGLIVIDSVAAVFRLNSNYVQRAKDMRRMANNLLSYIDQYLCAVVCVNQVISYAFKVVHTKNIEIYFKVATVDVKNSTVPCLGLAWANLARTRIKISKTPKQVTRDTQVLNVRKFELMYSPHTPSDSAEFVITSKGLMNA